MNEELRNVIGELSGDEAMKLAVAVQRDLEGDESEEAFRSLGPEQAQAFLDRLSGLRTALAESPDADAAEAAARAFLDAVLETGAFDSLVADSLMDTGVRFPGIANIVGWFTASFNVAKLLGIQFEYVNENKVITKTETGEIARTRTIRIAAGG